MADTPHLGPRIRRWRKQQGLSQARMASDLGISASYLNLIEHSQRALTVPVLLKLAEVYGLDLASLSDSGTARLVAEVREALADPILEDVDVTPTDLDDLVARQPDFARALTKLYTEYRAQQERSSVLAERVTDGQDAVVTEPLRLPSDEVSDFVESRGNFFETLEVAADELWTRANLDRSRLFSELAKLIEREHGVRVELARPDKLPGAVRHHDRQRRILYVSEGLADHSRRFQLAHVLAFLEHREELERLADHATLKNDESRALARVALANYFAGAVLMPYDAFLAEARRIRWDIELLEHRFGAGFEQVCHRMTTLRRPGDEGIPLHFIRIDIAGNISKRFSGSGIGFARYGGACPRWNVHGAFLTPGMIRRQVSQFPDGKTYFCIARTVRKAGGGFRVPQSRLAIGLGCETRYAKELVYSEGIDLEHEEAIVPVGVACRLCERLDCRQRAFPPVHHRIKIDEDRRGLSFYSSADSSGS
ncbi:MAG: short-chain fatty acyl-CoA regulator family protein [Planctomycetota bacterium]